MPLKHESSRAFFWEVNPEIRVLLDIDVLGKKPKQTLMCSLKMNRVYHPVLLDHFGSPITSFQGDTKTSVITTPWKINMEPKKWRFER